jgi:uncharacterized protein DUF4062
VSPRPTIFISAVSKELRSARQLVANTLTFLGYEPVWQDIFGTEGGDLREVLRQQIDQCKGVVQLVGQFYGAEPPAQDPEFGRVSYTQYEALYARKRGKKVWYLFMDESFPIDPSEPEPAELRQLQSSYRNVLKADTHLFHPLRSREALEAGVLKLRDDLAQLRRGAKRWAAGVAALLCLIALLVLWLVRGQGETKRTMAGMSDEMAKEGRAVEMIAKRFDSLSSTRGLIVSPKTPEEHYHNARVHELGGNFTAARQEYSEYLSANLEALDPWLSYEAMLKVAEGHAGAIETMRYFQKLKPQTVSYQTALALLDEGDTRLMNLQALAASHPDFGPLPWLISQEFSEARRGDQTLADQRAEKEWLAKFQEAQAAGKFQKYFIDKKEAQKWLDVAEARWAKLTSMPERVLENPVTLTMQESGQGWAAIFGLTDFKAKELFYKLDGKGDFQSTGHLPMKNLQTGLPMINLTVPLANLATGEHTIEVKYVDKNERTNGPYTLKFSTANEELVQGKMMIESSSSSWLSFRDYNGKVWLYFTTLMSFRPVLKEVRYSVNSDALDQTFKFKPSDKMYIAGDDISVIVPANSEFATVQVTFRDGTMSPVRKFVRQR